ncbi:hypothetical protein ACTGV0_10825, partial [Streptococcus suis]
AGVRVIAAAAAARLSVRNLFIATILFVAPHFGALAPSGGETGPPCRCLYRLSMRASSWRLRDDIFVVDGIDWPFKAGSAAWDDIGPRDA